MPLSIAGMTLLAACGRPETPSPAHATFQIVRVDDEVDPLADADPPPGVRIYREQSVHFARIAPVPGESAPRAEERARAWLAGMPLPAGKRFGLQVFEEPDDADSSHRVGARTYVLDGEPIVTEKDIVTAWSEPSPRGRFLLRITLQPDAIRRLESATRESKGQRFAFVVNGVVQSTPRMHAAPRATNPLSFEASSSDDARLLAADWRRP